jgi:hypothetical protein
MIMWNKNKKVSEQKEVVKLVCQFIPMFQGCKLEKESLAIYSKLLMDLPLENIKFAFEMLTTQTKFFPTVAEVREIAERLIWDSEFSEKYMGE